MGQEERGAAETAGQEIDADAARLIAARAGRMTLFTVRAQTGEYSDHSEWMVAVFLARAAAEAHEKACVDFAIANRLHSSQAKRRTNPVGVGLLDYEARAALRDDVKAGRVVAPDPEIRVDYTGIDYCVVELPLRVTSRFEAEAFADALMQMREALP